MIWRRYLFFRLASSFLFILGLTFLLYCIADFSSRGGKHFSKTPDLDTLLYYIDQFSTLLPLFFPFSFLLSTLLLLTDLNGHLELVAFQMGGLSIKKLLSPFFFFGALLFIISLANLQWLSPIAQKRALGYQEFRSIKKKSAQREHVHAIALADGSEIVYQGYNETRGELFDLFWIESPSKIWHMKYLEVNSMKGKFVEFFERDENRRLMKKGSYVERPFREIILDREEAFKPFIPYESRSLSNLFTQAIGKGAEKQRCFTHLIYKLIYPSFLFLIPLALGPIACRYSRSRSSFILIGASLFVFISVLMIFDGMLILSENQVFSPIFALLLPTFSLFTFFYRKFKAF